MSESDFEIEYLDEDEDLVQQCVQTVEQETNTYCFDSNADSNIVTKHNLQSKTDFAESITKYEPVLVPHLVERASKISKPKTKPASKRKIKEEESDSDYDPTEDYDPLNDDDDDVSLRSSKKKRQKLNTHDTKPVENPVLKKTVNVIKTVASNSDDELRKDVRIPDYDDPFCLPVRMTQKNVEDIACLRNWNKLCLDHYQQTEGIMKTKFGETLSSNRSVIFCKLKNKQTGKVETTMWGNTTVYNQNDQKKMASYRCILPPYKESQPLDFSFNKNLKNKDKETHTVHEVILTKEKDKDGDILVAYNTNDCISYVFKFENTVKFPSTEDDMLKDSEERKRRILKQTVNLKMCAPCYQTSWRGATKFDMKCIRCLVCSRVFLSTYSMLSHLKTHKRDDVRPLEKRINNQLANVMEYHYKCRICRMKFPSIKAMRQHVLTHKSNNNFYCEVGNHMTVN